MARFALSPIAAGIALAALGMLGFMDSVAARGSFRMYFRNTQPYMTLKYGSRSKLQISPLPPDWNSLLPSVLRSIEATARAADRRLLTDVSPDLSAKALAAAASFGPTRKLVTMYRRFRSPQTCGTFVPDAEVLSEVAERKHLKHHMKESFRIYAAAMERFQTGLNCYATRFVEVVLGRSSRPSLGLEGLSAGLREGEAILKKYQTASTHYSRLRYKAARAWETVVRLDLGVSFFLEMAGLDIETHHRAIGRAKVEMDAGFKSSVESALKQADALLQEEENSGTRQEASSSGADDAVEALEDVEQQQQQIINSAQELLSKLGLNTPQLVADDEEERSSEPDQGDSEMDKVDPSHSEMDRVDSSSQMVTEDQVDPSLSETERNLLSENDSSVPSRMLMTEEGKTSGGEGEENLDSSDLPPLPDGDSPLLDLAKALEDLESGGS